MNDEEVGCERACSAGWEGEGAGELLTSRALDILAAATRPPQGRLAVLHVSFVPAVTVEALYRFIRGTCARPSCSRADT